MRPDGSNCRRAGQSRARLARRVYPRYERSRHFSSTRPIPVSALFALRPFPFGGIPVKQLIAYLLDHAIIDFSGDLTLDMVRDFLREDDSPEGRKLLGKLVEDRGVDDMVVTLADCLHDYLRTGITDDVVREQIRLYSES